MLKNILTWAFLCITAPFVCSQETSMPDSIEDYISTHFLDEVVVKASSTINKTDGKVVRPNKEMLRTSADGIDLLRKLQLPRITVNPMTNSIDVMGGGEVILCINGVESTSVQVMAIPPQEILKIEYHDTPGIRYSGAAIVIDYITSRQESGGNLFLNSFGAFGKGHWASIDNFAAQYNQGRSVWAANVAYFGKQSDKWLRDYDEVWHYPDAMISRHEYGLPVTVSNHSIESSLNYNYMHASGNIFNVRLDFNLDEVPNKEEGDRRAILETSELEQPIEVREHTEEHSIQPNLGIYYQHKLSEDKSLKFDAQGSYMRSRMLHEYFENEIGESSRVKGDKYAFKFLGMYESRAGSRVWNVGVSTNYSYLRNKYEDDDLIKVNINQSETAVMGEYSNQFGNWGIMGNLKGVYRHLGQQGKNLDRLFLLPEVNISYRPMNNWFVRYAASMDYKIPLAAEISDVEQPIQSGMVRRGNPNLKPFRVINQSLDATFENSFVSANAHIEYRNEHKPIMESVIFEEGQFIRTYFNQRSFQRLMLGGNISVQPWKAHLSITARPMLTRYISHGIDYSHCHNIFRVGIGVDFSYGNWLAYGNIMSGPDNYMYGEEIIEEKDMNEIMVGYKRDKWSIHAGVFNAFINYWMETRNLSALTPYTSKAHNRGSSIYFAVKFNLMLDFGRKSREIDIQPNDIDRDSGIMTGTK